MSAPRTGQEPGDALGRPGLRRREGVPRALPQDRDTLSQTRDALPQARDAMTPGRAVTRPDVLAEALPMGAVVRHEDALTLEPEPRQVSSARRFVAQSVPDLDGDTADTLLLLVSELVTNAVRHGAPPVRLEVRADADVVRVSVRDGDPGLPCPRELDDHAEGGRGMVLVEMLDREHGVRAQPPGKTVWASVTRPGGERP